MINSFRGKYFFLSNFYMAPVIWEGSHFTNNEAAFQSAKLTSKIKSDEYLEEGNNWGDKVWGTVNGEGENNLGKILMRVRKELR